MSDLPVFEPSGDGAFALRLLGMTTPQLFALWTQLPPEGHPTCSSEFAVRRIALIRIALEARLDAELGLTPADILEYQEHR